MGKIGFGLRDLNCEDHFKELDINSYNGEGVELWCFPGNGTINKKKGTRFCASSERYIGLKLGDEDSSYKHVNLLGFYYPPKKDQPTIGEFSKEQRETIAYNMLVKKCLDSNGNPLPIEEVAKKFSLINISSHCWGAVEVSYIGGYAEAEMKKLGYTEDEIRFAFNQIIHLSYAPYTDHSSFPCVRVNSFIDSEFRDVAKAYYSAYKTKLNGVDIKYDKPGFFRNRPYFMSKVPIISIYSSQLINTDENSDLRSLIDEHGSEYLERNLDWSQGHQSNGAKNADLVSKLYSYSMAYAMAKSIQNKISANLIPKSTEEIFESLKSFYKGYSEEELKSKLSIYR